MVISNSIWWGSPLTPISPPINSPLEKIKSTIQQNTFGHGARTYIMIDETIIGEVVGITIDDNGDNFDSAFIMGSPYSQTNMVREKRVTGVVRGLFINSGRYLNKASNSYSSKYLTKGKKLISRVANLTGNNGVLQRFPRFTIAVISKQGFANGEPIFSGYKIHGCKFVGKNININFDKFWDIKLNFVASYIDDYEETNNLVGGGH